MKLKSIDYYCPKCETQEPHVVEIADDCEYPFVGAPATQPCRACGFESAEKRFGAPALMQRAMPDGTFRGEGFQLTKEIAQLKRKRRDQKGATKAETDKQIAHLNSTIVKKGYKDKFNS